MRMWQYCTTTSLGITAYNFFLFFSGVDGLSLFFRLNRLRSGECAVSGTSFFAVVHSIFSPFKAKHNKSKGSVAAARLPNHMIILMFFFLFFLIVLQSYERTIDLSVRASFHAHSLLSLDACTVRELLYSNVQLSSVRLHTVSSGCCTA